MNKKGLKSMSQNKNKSITDLKLALAGANRSLGNLTNRWRHSA